MTNHVHLLITPNCEEGLAKAIQMLGRYYVQYYNFCYRRTGTLWEGRYKATLIDSEVYLLICMRYIELNPARAAIEDHPSKYPWSSYHCNASGINDGLITPHALYQHLGRSAEERQSAYRQLFRHRISDATLRELRDTTNKAWVLGSSHFKERIEKQLGRRIEPAERGGDRRSKQYRGGA